MQFTEEQVTEAIEAAVKEKGEDYVYPEEEKRLWLTSGVTVCQYVRRDENGKPVGPSCIVGHVLARLGVPLEGLAANEGNCVTILQNELNFDMPAAVTTALDSAQDAQDRGLPWGEAFGNYRKRLTTASA